ncbi:clathrin interactor 1-like [Styela clava]|uniref:clathrin interactor 1-like n=1 Tax=Styela clava TaxID=7725 RepID=UPI00193A42D1|nr:clathrin interactor 1-like [Styela clava]
MNLLPWKIRELTDKVTNVVMNYTEVEARVREATNDEPWGPSGSLMQELANDTFMYETYSEVTGMLWKRIFHEGRSNWRRIYKGLLVVSYLLRNGSERFVTSTREHINDLRALQNFQFHDEHGKDQGINVRNKAKELVVFVKDNERLREERKKCKKNKNKYVGMSHEESKFGFRTQQRYDEDDYYRHRRQHSGSDTYHDSPSDGRRDTHRRNESNGSAAYSDDFDPTDNDRKSRGKESPRGVKYSFSVESLEQHSDKETIEELPKRISSPAITNNASKPRKAVPSKKVSLGAAAQYTGDQPAKISGSSQSKSSGGTTADTLDLFGSSTTESQQQPDLFSDFDSLATTRSAPNVAQEATTTNGDFADFGNFESNAAPSSSNVDLFTSTPQMSLDPFASFEGNQMPQQQQQTMMAPQMPQLQPQMNPTNMYNNQGFNMMNSTTPVIPQQPAANLMSPTSPNLMQANSAPLIPNQPTMAPSSLSQPISATPASTAASKPLKPNTWSDVKGVNIDLDLFGKSQKTAQPSMRQMQQGTPVGNVTMGMAGMNMTGQAPGMQSPQMPGMMGQGAPMGQQGMRMMPNSNMMPPTQPMGMMGMAGQPNMGQYNMNQMYGSGMGGMYQMQGVPAANNYNKPF